jgi:hypothetical protein
MCIPLRISFSQEDIERFREEMLRRQQNKPASNSDEQTPVSKAIKEPTTNDNSNAKDSSSSGSNAKDSSANDKSVMDTCVNGVVNSVNDPGTPEEEAMIR